MLKSFGDQATEDIFNGDNTKAARSVPRALWNVACRKLDMIKRARELRDLDTPGNRLEKLKGDLAGRHSVRINDQCRVVFVFDHGDASNVTITDYHS